MQQVTLVKQKNRDLIKHIEMLNYKQNMMSADMTMRDIFGYSVDKGWICIQYFH